MELEVGAIVDGKVTGITGFGAFVELGGGKSGLVHISEISESYVKDVNEYLSIGQPVRVMIIGTDKGRINLSMRKAQPKPKPEPERSDSFEDKLKKFMQESDSRIAGNPMYSDKGKQRRRRN